MNNSLIRVYESGAFPFRNSKRSLHLVMFLNIYSSEFSEIFAHKKYTPDMLLKLYNSVFKENNLMSQRIVSSCLLLLAGYFRVSELLYIKRSDIIFGKLLCVDIYS
jgi:hypothetical protein